MRTNLEVTIVGAGIIGSSIAWRLAQAGAAVHLIDSGKMGGESSWAGAGMLAPGGEFTEPSWWISMALDSLAVYPKYVAELEAESGVSIDYRACGAIENSPSETEWPAMVTRAEQQRRMGIACETRNLSLFYPNDAWVDPRAVMAALHKACTRHGVKITENSRQTAFEADGPLVIAAGAWSSSLKVSHRGHAMALPEAYPIKGYLLGYAMPENSLPTILRSGHTYLLQRSNGFTIAGSNEERAGFDRTVDPQACAELHQRAAALWPALIGHEPEQQWIGFRPGSGSGEPVIRQVPDTSVWLAYGHFRNGILMAPCTADRVASEILREY